MAHMILVTCQKLMQPHWKAPRMARGISFRPRRIYTWVPAARHKPAWSRRMANLLPARPATVRMRTAFLFLLLLQKILIPGQMVLGPFNSMWLVPAGWWPG